MSGIKTSVKFGRIEFTFYPDLLELAQSSDYPVIKAQTFTQETYHGHQLLHIRKVAFDEIHELRQLAVLFGAAAVDNVTGPQESVPSLMLIVPSGEVLTAATPTTTVYDWPTTLASGRSLVIVVVVGAAFASA